MGVYFNRETIDLFAIFQGGLGGLFIWIHTHISHNYVVRSGFSLCQCRLLAVSPNKLWVDVVLDQEGVWTGVLGAGGCCKRARAGVVVGWIGFGVLCLCKTSCLSTTSDFFNW